MVWAAVAPVVICRQASRAGVRVKAAGPTAGDLAGKAIHGEREGCVDEEAAIASAAA